jgi:hypothetical protein
LAALQEAEKKKAQSTGGLGLGKLDLVRFSAR